ncbi:MAG: uroporphyrinogen-III synthase, partial [Steroidobacteraceae bacterium]
TQARPVVVTRAEGADGPLSRELRALGLAVLLWPAVSITAGDPRPLEAALRDAGSFGWIVFASRRAVAAVLERLPAAPAGVRVAAIGRATAQVLRQRGWPVDLTPDEANAGALIGALAARVTQADRGVRFLYPASSRALPTLAAGLKALGFEVTQVEAYRTEPAALDVEGCRAWIQRRAVGAVTFASPSAVIELRRALGDEDFALLLADARPVAIGRTTARELTRQGLRPVISESATLESLARTTLRMLQATA